MALGGPKRSIYYCSVGHMQILEPTVAQSCQPINRPLPFLTPSLVVYCFGIFALMMLSLLESILVMYLMEKDSLVQDNGRAEKPAAVSEDRQIKDKNTKRVSSRGECGILLQQVTVDPLGRWRGPMRSDHTLCTCKHYITLKV